MERKHWIKFNREFSTGIKDLNNEIHALRIIMQKNNSRFWYRVLARSIFSYIEFSLSYMKKHILLTNEKDEDLGLSNDDLLVLNDVLDNDKNEINPKVKRLSLKKNIKFVFEKFAYSNWILDYEFSPNKNDWNTFMNAISIRNRVTHPKSTKDLRVKITDVKILIKTYEWFYTTFKKAHYSAARELTKMLIDMNKVRFNKKEPERHSY